MLAPAVVEFQMMFHWPWGGYHNAAARRGLPLQRSETMPESGIGAARSSTRPAGNGTNSGSNWWVIVVLQPSPDRFNLNLALCGSYTARSARSSQSYSPGSGTAPVPADP